MSIRNTYFVIIHVTSLSVVILVLMVLSVGLVEKWKHATDWNLEMAILRTQ